MAKMGWGYSDGLSRSVMVITGGVYVESVGELVDWETKVGCVHS